MQTYLPALTGPSLRSKKLVLTTPLAGGVDIDSKKPEPLICSLSQRLEFRSAIANIYRRTRQCKSLRGKFQAPVRKILKLRALPMQRSQADQRFEIQNPYRSRIGRSKSAQTTSLPINFVAPAAISTRGSLELCLGVRF